MSEEVWRRMNELTKRITFEVQSHFQTNSLVFIVINLSSQKEWVCYFTGAGKVNVI